MINNLKNVGLIKYAYILCASYTSLDFKCLAWNVSYDGKSTKAVRNARKLCSVARFEAASYFTRYSYVYKGEVFGNSSVILVHWGKTVFINSNWCFSQAVWIIIDVFYCSLCVIQAKHGTSYFVKIKNGSERNIPFNLTVVGN